MRPDDARSPLSTGHFIAHDIPLRGERRQRTDDAFRPCAVHLQSNCHPAMGQQRSYHGRTCQLLWDSVQRLPTSVGKSDGSKGLGRTIVAPPKRCAWLPNEGCPNRKTKKTVLAAGRVVMASSAVPEVGRSGDFASR